jgi:hypothetical protein
VGCRFAFGGVAERSNPDACLRWACPNAPPTALQARGRCPRDGGWLPASEDRQPMEAGLLARRWYEPAASMRSTLIQASRPASAAQGGELNFVLRRHRIRLLSVKSTPVTCWLPHCCGRQPTVLFSRMVSAHRKPLRANLPDATTNLFPQQRTQRNAVRVADFCGDLFEAIAGALKQVYGTFDT